VNGIKDRNITGADGKSTELKEEIKVMLRLTVSHSARVGSEYHDQILGFVKRGFVEKK
jgi:hypothetical protein